MLGTVKTVENEHRRKMNHEIEEEDTDRYRRIWY